MLAKFILDKFFEKTKGYFPFFKYCPSKYRFHYFNKRASRNLGYEYNFLQPKTLNEKIMWLAYNEKLDLKTQLTDKIKVKDYITEKIGVDHCAKILGIWDDFNEIDFSELPDMFLLKVNHSWKKNLFLSKNMMKSSAQREKYRKLTREWLKMNYFEYSIEPQYKNIKPKLYVEEVLSFENGNFKEYQIHCFNGTPVYIESFHFENGKIGVTLYDLDWNRLPFKLKNYKAKDAPKPNALEQMIEYARILSEGFTYVRVDFYVNKYGIFVLELTFTPHSAEMCFCDTMYDMELGNRLKLPN